MSATIIKTRRTILLEDARTELTDAIEDLFVSANNYSKAGDHAMAQAVSKHAHALRALLAFRSS